MHKTRLLSIAAGVGLFLAVPVVCLGTIAAFQVVQGLSGELHAVSALKKAPTDAASEVYDRSGAKIGEFAAERRYQIQLKQVPEHVIQAFLSAEDKDFFSHHGISPTAILRSMVANVRGGGIRQGASTITQQLARLTFLTPSRTWTRKVKEMILAVAIEQVLSKNEILELYLNKIYLGNHSYGVEAAARNYFRKGVEDLSVGEAALLAGLPKAPSRYAPNRFPKRADRRQAVVLKRMAEDGHLTFGAAKAWAKTVVNVMESPESSTGKAPYFIAAVRRDIEKRLELHELPREGLKIYTTLDQNLQALAATKLAATLKQVRRGAVSNVPHKGRIDGALVAISPATGAVVAMQGGEDYAVSQFDRASMTKRRMASLFVPIYVSLALDRGYSLTTPLGADPMTLAAKDGDGGATLFDAVAGGKFMEAARLYTALGGGTVLEHARRLGLQFDRDDLMMSLGYGEATPYDVAGAYATFANDGCVVTPYLIEKIVTADGREIYHAPIQPPCVRAFSEQTAYQMRQLFHHAGLADGFVPESDALGGVAAVTDDLHNAWFAAVSKTLTAAIWIGSENGRTRLSSTDGEAAAAVAGLGYDLFTALPKGYAIPDVDEAPPGVAFKRVQEAVGGDGKALRLSLPFAVDAQATRF